MNLYIKQAQWVGHKGILSVLWLLFKKISRCYIFVNHYIFFLREDEEHLFVLSNFTSLTVCGLF